jgi:AraC family transcriptional regulator
MKRWLKVRKELGSFPITEGEIGGKSYLYAERYLFRSIEKSVSGINTAALLTQFGGARVHEGEVGQWRTTSLPSQVTLVPANCATHWHYSGAIDFAVFYFPEKPRGILERLSSLTKTSKEPLTFNDNLVSAASLQLLNELATGTSADEAFMARLADVMLEQTYRTLTTSSVGRFDPRHVHYSRLQAVLSFIHENLSQELSAQLLADRAEVSLAHFRRLFEEAMGVPVHRYVLNTRLDQARKLLTLTTMPISRIAEDCGFSNQSHLTACFKKAHAATPAQFRSLHTP